MRFVCLGMGGWGGRCEREAGWGGVGVGAYMRERERTSEDVSGPFR